LSQGHRKGAGVVLDRSGERFGRLLVVRHLGSDTHGRARWLCECDCGTLTAVNSNHLGGRLGTSSCGCLMREATQTPAAREARARALRTHGHGSRVKVSPTYRSWAAAQQRCSNPKNKRYDQYGGRGIRVCERWRSFENFLSDMGERPPGTSLDRIENERGYEPGNCRWLPDAKQAANRRDTVRAPDGRPIVDIARERGISGRTLCRAFLRRGVDPYTYTPPPCSRIKKPAATSGGGSGS
jgi:hypothetical protein